MAVEHVVLFKLKSDAPEIQKEALLRNLLALRDRIPGVFQASAGVNFSARAQGYTHGFVVRFKDRPALEAYVVHPAHVAVVEQYVKPVSEAVLALDYEIL
jgi:hypothetical protein